GLETQRQASTKRENTYRSLDTLSDKSQIIAVNAHPIRERLQYAFSESSGQELRAAALVHILKLPDPSSGIANRPFNVKIGIISALFLFKSFEGLADFRPIYPDNYQQHADIDILLLVSTWRGVDGVSWKGVTTKSSEKRAHL